MILIKTADEIRRMKESAEILSKTFGLIKQLIRPGVKTSEIDAEAEKFIRIHGAVPSFKGYQNYPASLCISVNEQVVHGIPSQYKLKEGDIVSVDGGVFYEGYHSDMAYTFVIGSIPPITQKLISTTKEALYLAIEKIKEGVRLGDIGYIIQQHVERNGFSVVRDLVGHGIGKTLHEAPQVPNYGTRGKGVILKEGMTLAVEPMVNMGKRHVYIAKDGWTVVTTDGLPSAHFEHTVVVRKNEAEILTSYKYIEN
ncbi:MAG: type I methionyl aminopeptidase [Bacteroidales bacterium]|nr:type I methionyl aminopeptidase [Bacteroidales bacterium]